MAQVREEQERQRLKAKADQEEKERRLAERLEVRPIDYDCSVNFHIRADPLLSRRCRTDPLFMKFPSQHCVLCIAHVSGHLGDVVWCGVWWM